MNATITRPSEPVKIGASELCEATCRVCRAKIWAWDHESLMTSDGRHTVCFDRELCRGDELLSLHPCIHEWAAEDFDDPDWGWVER